VSDLEFPKLRALEAFPTTVDGQTVVCLRDPEGVSDQVASLPPGLAPFLFEMLDGEHSLMQIREEYGRLSGGGVMALDDLLRLLGQLDEALFLETPRYEARVAEILAAYRDAPVRAPTSAGNGYPAEPGELDRFLSTLYDGLPPAAEGGTLRAIAVPHLDLRFGGRAAARGLVGLDAAFDGNTVVVLGVGHHLGRLPYALTTKDFSTPLGTVPVDRDMLDRVVEKAGSWLLEEELVHRFLMDGVDPAADPMVDVFLETLREEAGDALLYASVDLAHMGPVYGDPEPLTAPDLEAIEEEDRVMLGRMAARDAKGFFDHLADCRDRRRVCGSSSLYTTLSLLPDGPDGELLTYEQPVFPDEGNTVTICAMRWA